MMTVVMMKMMVVMIKIITRKKFNKSSGNAAAVAVFLLDKSTFRDHKDGPNLCRVTGSYIGLQSTTVFLTILAG
nr:hypothetical protein [Tanacetum cinerariifolium]